MSKENNRKALLQKYRFVLTFIVFAGVILTLSSNSNGRATQANAGNTGATGETTCGQCHNGNSFGTVSAVINIFEVGTSNPVLAYIPGTTYDMRVTINNTAGNPGGRGFQMTCLTSPGNQPLAGYSNLASNVKQKTLTVGPQNGRTYVEHNGVTANNQFNFQWTAPAVGQGTVRFTASGNAVNLNNATSGDGSGATSLLLPQAEALTASLQPINVSCFGATDGSILVTVNTGVPPYSYLWSDGSTAEDRVNLNAGAYSVTITDAVGQLTTLQATITQPTVLTTSGSAEDALFPDGDGSITLTASGGTPDYTFFIEGIGVVDDFPFSIAPGSYSYSVTDQNGCVTTSSVLVSAPAPLVVDVNITDVTCADAADGSLDVVSIAGATPPYTLIWSQGDQLINLDGGMYSLLVTDAVGYNLEFFFEINEPEPLQLSSNIENIGCFGEEAVVTLSPTGGTSPYIGAGSFSLEPGNYTFDVVDANGCTISTSVEVVSPAPLEISTTTAELPCAGGTAFIEVEATGGTPPYQGVGPLEVNFAGHYPIEVVDANGCIQTTMATVVALDGPTTTALAVAPLCFDSCDGSIEVEIQNAVEPVNYAWSNEASGSTVSNLCAGSYSVTITDGAGCTLVGTYSVPTTPQLELSIDLVPIACFGDSTSAEALVAGGTGPYSIEWLDADASNLQAGSYEVMVTDANACTLSQTLEVTQPEQLTATASINDVDCFGNASGSITLSLSGGSGLLTALWSNGIDEINLEDALAGSYSVVVTDANGCDFTDSYEIEQPEALEITNVAVTPVTEEDGSIALDVLGGTPPYSFLWSSGETTQNIGAINSAGVYTLTVTDAFDCTVSIEIEVEQIVGVNFVSSPKVSFYPNPAHDALTVVSAEPMRQITILDLQGRTVLELPVVAAVEVIVQVATLPVGSYYIQVVTEGGAFSKQFVKI